MSEPEVAFDEAGDVWILVPNSLIFTQKDLGPGTSWVRHNAPRDHRAFGSLEGLVSSIGNVSLFARVDQ